MHSVLEADLKAKAEVCCSNSKQQNTKRGSGGHNKKPASKRAEKDNKESEEYSAQLGQKIQARGRPRGSKKSVSQKAIAEATGISRTDQQRAERHGIMPRT
jgi:hypothetical protein